MSKYVTLFLQFNLARRHMPTAALNRLIDELTPFSFLARNVDYLDGCLQTSAFVEVLNYIRQLADHNGKLPRIVPIACVQEPNLTNGKPTGFPGKLILSRGSHPRSAIVTLRGTSITLIDQLSSDDITWALITYKNFRSALCSFYSDINCNCINLRHEQARKLANTTLMLGDSNAHSTIWGNETNNTRGDIWEQYLMRNALSPLNHGITPTFDNHIGSSCIDLSLTNRPANFTNWHNTEIQLGSDHTLILLTACNGKPSSPKLVQNIARTNWSIFKSALPLLDNAVIRSTSDLEARAALISNNITSAFNRACPPKPPYPGKVCKWWTSELSNLLRNKNLAARRARKYKGKPIGFRALKAKRQLGSLFQKIMRIEKDKSWESFTSNLTGYKNISSLLKSMKSDKSYTIPLLRGPDNKMANNTNENLDILRNSHYRNSALTYLIHKGDSSPLTKTLPDSLSDFMNEHLLRRAISSLPNNKAPGPDGLKNELIKQLPSNYVLELLNLIRTSLATGYIPSSWLEAEAIFIKKGGNRAANEPKSYRPIGLTSVILKLCERMVNWRLKDTVLSKGVPRQHAFTIGLSTETAISEVTHFLEKAKLNGLKAMILSIDVMGAFDTIPFDVIKQSLIDHGVEQEIVCWLDYLSRNRVVMSKMNFSIIRFRPMEGTTQGGINGPDIWIICIWAIIFTRAARTSKLAKFADDLISAIMGHDLKVLRDVLQSCLEEFVNWFSSRGLKISPQKSYCMIVNKGRKILTPRQLSIDGSEIPYVDSFGYLGVTIDCELSWKPHVQNRLKKAKSDLMVARRLVSTNWGLSPEKMSWVYTAIVRPTIDYCSHVWFPAGPLPRWLENELDKVQRLALTAITSCIHTTPTRALERLTNLKPLALHLKEKSATTVARILIDKSNWDGIGKLNKRGHLFLWMKFLGPDLPPLTKSHRYNFTSIETHIGDGLHHMKGLSIYTDGSKTPQGTGSGWAIYHDDQLICRGCRRLPKHSSVYEAEMLAILFALDDLDLMTKFTDLPDKATTLVDNQSTLKTLNSIKLMGDIKLRVLDRIVKFMADRRCKLIFKWIRGHSNDVGNDMADECAKMGTTCPDFYYIKPSLSYIKSVIRSRINLEWNSQWQNLPTCRQSKQLISFIPDNKNRSFLLSRGRQGCRRMVSLLTGHNHLKYHVFKRKVSCRPNVSPVCRFCETDLETSWHLLHDCPRFDTRRRVFIFSPDNPKTGPDIKWYHDLATRLGILDLLMDRSFLDELEEE